MVGWFLIFFLSLFVAISVFLHDPTLKDYRSSLLSSLRESKLALYSYKIETPNIKESRVLGVNAVGDERIPLLRGYLQAKDSPLASKSAEMVATADRYQFDWRLLPAIAGKESSFGKKIPWDKEGQKPSYNAWGWGIYGDQVLSFSSWDEGIEKVGAGLRDGYFNRNLITIEDVMRYFTPRSNGSWARDVSFIMEQIERQ